MLHLIRKFIFATHRVLGTIFSVLFLMWIFSAFVLMYHHFPRVNAKMQLEKKEKLTSSADTLPAPSSLYAKIDNIHKVKDVKLQRYLGKTFFSIKSGKKELMLTTALDTMKWVANHATVMQTAHLWSEQKISKIDTLHSLEQWIPFGNLKSELPIYKIYFDGSKHEQLYVSSKDAHPLQFSNRSQRFWSWLGPIPHWVYFTWLRQDKDLWANTIIVISIFGLIMLIAGAFIAFDVWKRSRESRRKNGRFSPYKKKWYHIHYVGGIFIGIFLFTFLFSGMMSVANVPSWIFSPTLQESPSSLNAGIAPLTAYKLDYRTLVHNYPDAKVIEWHQFNGHPFYLVQTDKADFYIDASGDTIQPLALTEGDIKDAIENFYKKSEAYQNKNVPAYLIERLDKFELFYRNMKAMTKGEKQLPVWKITVQDADNSVLYINPSNAKIRYVNTGARWKYWMYTALHRMRIPGLNSNNALRKGVLWILLIGGAFVATSGFVLGIKYISRKNKKKKRHNTVR